LLWNLIPALPLCCLLLAGLLRAQIPAGTPTYNVNAKWVTDRGSQVFNVKAYGAVGNGTTDDTAAILAARTAAVAAHGILFFPSGSYPISSQLAIQGYGVTVQGYGATITCNVAASCILLGTTVGSSYNNSYGKLAIYGLSVAPGVGSGPYPAIQDDAMGDIIQDVAPVTNSPYYWHNFIEVDTDWGLTISGLIWNGASVLECDATYCGNAVYESNNAYENSGIAHISNSELSMGCDGNGFDWESGGDLSLTCVMLEAYNQYGVRSNGNVSANDMYFEVGSCRNPIGNVGQAAFIGLGGLISHMGGQTGAGQPVFPQAGTTGSTVYGYYIVGHYTAGGNVTAPLPAGYLTNGNATVNATNYITVTWNDFGGAGYTYDVLRYVYTWPRTAPYGTGNFAVATALAEASTCSAGLCTFTDNVTSPASYTVAGANWVPVLSMWPGALVLSAAGASNNCFTSGRYYGSSFNGGDMTIACGTVQPGLVTFISGPIDNTSTRSPISPGYVTMLNSINPNNPNPALLLPGNGGGLKGELNFSTFGGGYADAITLNDSVLAKSLSSIANHPAYDVGDTAISFDGWPTALAFRAPNTISDYINSLPDGVSWLERLTSGVKTFKVPLNAFSVAQSSTPYLAYVNDVATGGTLSPNTQYCYRAAAVDSLGATAPNTEVCVTTANDGNSTHSVSMLIQSQALAGGYKVYGRTSGAEQLMTPTPITNAWPTYWTSFTDTGSVTPSGALPTANTTGQIKPALYSTATNCSSSASPAVCGSAAAGSFVIAASATSVVVNTSAVTANSQILLTEDSSLGTKLGVTCNTQSLLTLGVPKVTARTAGTGFTASIEVGPTTNPLCISYAILN